MTENPKKRKVTEAHMRATAKWESANYDKGLIRFPKGTKDRIAALGATLNGYVVKATLAQLDRDENATD